jgi:hypothetical protein
MRWMFSIVVVLSVAGPETTVAQKLKLPNPLIVNGETFTNPVYESHDASRLNITHKTGAASLHIAQLPNGLPNKLGYNRSNALAAEEELKKRQQEAEAQSQIERNKMWEQARAASRRGDIVDRNAEKVGQPHPYNRNSNPHAGYSSPPRSSVAQPSTVRGEPLTSSDVIRAQWGWGPSPLASNEELARWRAANPSMVSADFPTEWGGRPTGTSRRARQRQQEWDEQRAFQIASQAGPEAMQAYIERRDAAKARQELENMRNQQNHLQWQVQQMEWQQQIQRSEIQRMEWQRQTQQLNSPW